MIHRILVPLDHSPYTDAALKYACDIALKNEAEITGMAIVDIPGIGKAVGGVPQGALYYAEKLKHFKTREAHRRIETVMEKFLGICREAGVRHQVAECQGCPSDRILEGAHFFDLVIMGLRTYYQFGDRPGDSLVKVLDHAICPVLAVPPEYMALQRVLIAYDRSIPASRTLQHFVHFANAYDFEVKLLTAHKDRDIAQYYLDEAEKYLRAYALENITREWSDKPVAEIYDEKYRDWPDLIVAGLHSKKGIFDFMVGSFSRHLITVSRKPLYVGQ